MLIFEDIKNFFDDPFHLILVSCFNALALLSLFLSVENFHFLFHKQ